MPLTAVDELEVVVEAVRQLLDQGRVGVWAIIWSYEGYD